ncbi:MAG: tetratricopeptide repeat protein, partial [Bacteroidetes bacterium]|nr:tetratricopeptide repeat protein [Bacteroidota bacterium]
MKTDSLISVIRNAIHDSSRIKALNALAYIRHSSNPDTSILLSGQALKLSEENGLETETGNSCHQLGLYYWKKGDYILSLGNFSKAIAIWERFEKNADDTQKPQFRNRKARALCNMGIIYSDQGNFPRAMDNYFMALKAFED